MTEYLDIEVSVCGLARNTFRDTIMKFLYFLLTVISFQYRVTRVSGIKDNSLIFRTVPLRVIFEGHSVRFYGRNIKISQNDSGTKFHVSKKKTWCYSSQPCRQVGSNEESQNTLS